LVAHGVHFNHQSTWISFVDGETKMPLPNLPKLTMYAEDYEEWRWGQILTRNTNFNPDDQPTKDDDETPQNDE
jgi:hypothetical protein